MTQTEFGQMLRSIIGNYDLSINGTIKRTGINRSSFYKFLNGERLPTPAHLQEIIHALTLSDADASALQSAYEEVRYGTVAWINHEIVRECLESISEAEFNSRITENIDHRNNPAEETSDGAMRDPAGQLAASRSLLQAELGPGPILGRPAVNAAIVRFLELSCTLQGSSSICTFLPLEATHILVKYSPRFYLKHGTEVKTIHFLFHFSSTTDDIDRHSAPKFHDLIPLTLSVHCAVHFFYGASSLLDGLGLLYPYYLISDLGVLFINPRMEEAYLESSENSIRINRAAYERVLPLSEEITQENSSLAEIQERILSAVQSAERLYLIDSTPCMSLIATKELIDRFLPEETRAYFWHYCSTLQAAEPVEIVSAGGIRQMVTQRSLTESDIHVQISEELVHQILLGLRARLGRTFFIADGSHITVPEDWMISIIPDQSINLASYRTSYDTVSFLEKNVIRAFSVALQRDMDYFVLEQKAAERILDYYIDQTAGDAAPAEPETASRTTAIAGTKAKTAAEAPAARGKRPARARKAAAQKPQ